MSSHEQKRREVRDQALELVDNESQHRLICPWCRGGPSKDLAFSVTRKGSVALYKCHRATCGVSGNIDIGFTSSIDMPSASARKANKQHPIHLLEYLEVPSQIYQFLHKKYYITDDDIYSGGWKWIRNRDRLAMPIRGYDGRPVGIVARSFIKGVSPKAITYLHKPDAAIAAFYAPNYESHKLWVVEDQISAVRASEHVNTVALCGCNMSTGAAYAMKLGKFTDLVLALDSDAFSKAIDLKIKYAELFKTIKVIKLPKDLKNMAPIELKEFIRLNG